MTDRRRTREGLALGRDAILDDLLAAQVDGRAERAQAEYESLTKEQRAAYAVLMANGSTHDAAIRAIRKAERWEH